MNNISDNISPEKVAKNPLESNSTTTSEYFTDANLLTRVPLSVLYLTALYTALIVIGFSLVADNSKNAKTNSEDQNKLSKTFNFLWSELLPSRNFWLLFLTRY